MMLNSKKILLIISSTALLLFVGVVIFAVVNKVPSEKKVANEADELKIANARAMSNLRAGQTTEVRPADKDDYFFNKTGGDQALIVYWDFDCSFCRRYYEVLKQTKESFKNDLNIVWRHFPLDSHPGALLAAQAFECAREQDKAEALAEALFDNQNKNDNNTEGILADAQSLGLRLEDFKQCLVSEKYKAKILAQKEEAELFGVNGTPTSFLNERNLPGAYQFEDFTDSTGRQNEGLKTLIEKELVK